MSALSLVFGFRIYFLLFCSFWRFLCLVLQFLIDPHAPLMEVFWFTVFFMDKLPWMLRECLELSPWRVNFRNTWEWKFHVIALFSNMLHVRKTVIYTISEFNFVAQPTLGVCFLLKTIELKWIELNCLKQGNTYDMYWYDSVEESFANNKVQFQSFTHLWRPFALAENAYEIPAYCIKIPTHWIEILTRVNRFKKLPPSSST